MFKSSDTGIYIFFLVLQTNLINNQRNIGTLYILINMSDVVCLKGAGWYGTLARGGYRIFKSGGCGPEKWFKKAIRA